MSQSKHTPGPWKWLYSSIDDEMVYRVIPIQRPGTHFVTNEADARLVAAAPELLHALELTIRYLDHPEVKTIPFAMSVDAAIEQARAAIAKAKGES